MIIHPGEKIHVVFRQFFDGDARRHFVGIVEQCEGTVARARGYHFAEEVKLNRVVNFVRREDVRERIIPLGSEMLIVNILPKQVEIDKIEYKFDVSGVIRVTDGSDWHLDLSHL